MYLDENKLRELLTSPLAKETVEHLYQALDGGMITSADKPTMTVGTRHYLDKLLANHFGWSLAQKEQDASR